MTFGERKMMKYLLDNMCVRRFTLFEARRIKGISVRKVHNQSPQITKGKVTTDDTTHGAGSLSASNQLQPESGLTDKASDKSAHYKERIEKATKDFFKK